MATLFSFVRVPVYFIHSYNNEQQPPLLRFYSIVCCKFQEGNTCVSFNSSSRYLLTGGKSKTLNIWDMKTKSIKKTYKVSPFKEENNKQLMKYLFYGYQLMFCTFYGYGCCFY